MRNAVKDSRNVQKLWNSRDLSEDQWVHRQVASRIVRHFRYRRGTCASFVFKQSFNKMTQIHAPLSSTKFANLSLVLRYFGLDFYSPIPQTSPDKYAVFSFIFSAQVIWSKPIRIFSLFYSNFLSHWSTTDIKSIWYSYRECLIIKIWLLSLECYGTELRPS